jgi:hypothetical protein
MLKTIIYYIQLYINKNGTKQLSTKNYLKKKKDVEEEKKKQTSINP